jgi:hypothetical protein
MMKQPTFGRAGGFGNPIEAAALKTVAVDSSKAASRILARVPIQELFPRRESSRRLSDFMEELETTRF